MTSLRCDSIRFHSVRFDPVTRHVGPKQYLSVENLVGVDGSARPFFRYIHEHCWPPSAAASRRLLHRLVDIAVTDVPYRSVSISTDNDNDDDNRRPHPGKLSAKKNSQEHDTKTIKRENSKKKKHGPEAAAAAAAAAATANVAAAAIAAALRSSRDLPRQVVLVAKLVVAEVARLPQQPLEVLPRRADVELGRGLLYEWAGGHHHDVRVLREIADEHGEI